MATVKVSEMATATSFENDDYTMIIQNNKNKKITRQDILGNIENNIGNLSNLTTTNKTSLVGAVNEVNDEVSDLISVSLYDDIDGTVGTVTLSDSAANYSYIEIYFYVNEGGGRIHKSVKVSNPNTSYALLDMTDFNNNALVFNTNLVYINTTEITRIRNRRFTIAESSSWTPYGSVANIVIKKVVGYK